MVSRQQAGLRQSYIENGRIRFSRLGRVDFSDPRVIAQDCAAESLRIQQYLVNSRILPREAPALDVLVLAPSEHRRSTTRPVSIPPGCSSMFTTSARWPAAWASNRPP